MKKRKAYKFAIKTNAGLENKLARFAGSCRFVWNRALALQKERLDAGEKVLRYGKACALITAWKREEETAWLKESPIHPLQQSLKDLDRAFMDAFDKQSPKRFPRFKKRGQSDSFRYPDPGQFEVDQGNSRIKLPKLGWVRYRKSRDIEGVPKQITVSRRGGRWYVSIQVEIESEQPVHPYSQNAVGIDMGVVRFATLSDGSHIGPLNSFRKLEKKLAREQRSLSRKVKFSSNWKKQKARVSKLHVRIADARNDFLHKASTEIAKNHGTIIVEDLKVSNMSCSAKGTLETPGNNVRAKSGLNKAILDQGWFEFRRQLGYKLEWAGGKLVAVCPQNTSRKCSGCGHVAKESRKSQSRFVCVECGHEAHADHNAALNILAAGLAVSACGEGALATSMKQEPTGRAA